MGEVCHRASLIPMACVFGCADLISRLSCELDDSLELSATDCASVAQGLVADCEGSTRAKGHTFAVSGVLVRCFVNGPTNDFLALERDWL